jgi:hypothetical protein
MNLNMHAFKCLSGWTTGKRDELFFGQKPGVLQCPDSKYDWFDYFNRFLLVFI